MIDEEPRSRETRARAERALVLLVHALGEDAPFVVLGGLVPELLTDAHDAVIPEHLGTTDVDVLLSTHTDDGERLSAIERALVRLEFRAAEGGWRWRGRVGGRPVKIEFLCDLDDQPEDVLVRPAACSELAAMNLRGTGYVARDFGVEELSAELAGGELGTVRVRFARLAGYLLAKCVAARRRGLEKDYYDLVYVLLHNREGGPEAATLAVRDGPVADALPGLQSTFAELRERYRGPRDAGPSGYALQSLQVDPEADAALLRQDAVDAAGRFFGGLAV